MFFLAVLAGCEPSSPPPPSPKEVAMSNLHNSWNLGTAYIGNQFVNASCESKVNKDLSSDGFGVGDYVVCTAIMKGYVHESMWHCSVMKKGRCRRVQY